jgi:hypothetical protein
MINDIFAEKDIGKNNNIEKNTNTSDTSKYISEKCSPWDPRC